MSKILSTRAASRERLGADLALFSVAVIWGSAFVAQRIVAATSSVFLFNGLRFLLASLAILPLILFRRKRMIAQPSSRIAWRGMLAAGLLLACGASFQQAGLRYTTASNAGFITGLYVVLIPIVEALLLKRSPRRIIWLAALMSTIGLFLLSTGGSLSFKFGDVLELAGAFFWALHVIWIGHLARRTDGFELAAGQYLVCGIACLSLGLLVEPHQAQQLAGAGWAIVYTGLISVALGYTIQIFGQRVAPPADAAVLLSLEAVFAALFGWLFLSEALNAVQILGCCVMLAGMLAVQIVPGELKIGYDTKSDP